VNDSTSQTATETQHRLIQKAPGLLSAEQHTLADAVVRRGVGLHSGQSVTVTLMPAPVGSGRRFVRVDQPGQPEIVAQVGQVRETMLSTELATDVASVRTVEHLLAALVGIGIDNARIELDGGEVPLLDGSGQGWVEAIAQAGITAQPVARPVWAVEQPIWVREGDAFVAALPAPALRLTYGIDFELAAIGNQWCSWSPDQEPFAEAIAPARTFGLLHQIEHLRTLGLIKGGTLDNALICGNEGWINPPLRFANEPARHKLLDLVGDLSLAGVLPIAHFLAYKASHRLHVQLAAVLAEAAQAA
jgi:UDP-3-O-[3-hydroxymyristoyl] N-acetylglucosamine deacetylase